MSKDKLTCASCGMRTTTIFSRVPVDAFDRIEFLPNTSVHHAQDVLISQNSKTNSIYTIRKGIVKLESRLSDGGKRIVRLLSHGDTLGLQAWQMGEHPHDAVALTEVELCHIPYEKLEDLQKHNSDLNRELIYRSCVDSRQADKWITEFSTGSVIRRMAYLIRYLLEIQQVTGDEVQLFGREDMAAILGVRQESISRTLSQFKTQEILTQLKRDSYRVDRNKLEDILN